MASWILLTKLSQIFVKVVKRRIRGDCLGIDRNGLALWAFCWLGLFEGLKYWTCSQNGPWTGLAGVNQGGPLINNLENNFAFGVFFYYYYSKYIVRIQRWYIDTYIRRTQRVAVARSAETSRITSACPEAVLLLDRRGKEAVWIHCMFEVETTKKIRLKLNFLFFLSLFIAFFLVLVKLLIWGKIL